MNALIDEMSKIGELIKRRRYQILVHSCIYYEYDTNLIPDWKYDKWAHELAELQQKHPRIAAKQPYAEAFKDYDGSTGAFLPIHDANIQITAKMLVENA